MLISPAARESVVRDSDVVSFDVFDTLLARTGVRRPQDVFFQLALEHGYSRDDARKFRSARKKAEAAAREAKIAETGHSEVTLEEIYARLDSSKYRVTADDEWAFEKRVLCRRAAGADLYELAVAEGKRVVAISDTYFTTAQVTELLQDNGYEMAVVYASADHGGGKYNGHLYAVFREHELTNGQSWCHIGDNEQADFHAAIEAGALSLLNPKAVDKLPWIATVNRSTCDVLADQDDPFLDFIIANAAERLDSDPTLDASTLFALFYGGPVVTAFVRWLESEQKRTGVEKLYLMSRDGYTLAHVIEELGLDINFEVLQISRRGVCLPAFHDDVHWRKVFEGSEGESLESVVRALDVRNEDELFQTLGKLVPTSSRYVDLSPQVRTSVVEAATAWYRPAAEQEADDYRRYLDGIGFDATKSAVVDVGWNLSSHAALEQLLGEKLYGFYVGTSPTAEVHDKISCYAFRTPQNAWAHVYYCAVELLELPFCSPEKQFVRMNGVGPILREPLASEKTRWQVANVIREEILEFARATRRATWLQYDDEAIRNGLREALFALSAFPTEFERYFIGSIPHERAMATRELKHISDYWLFPHENRRSRFRIPGMWRLQRFMHEFQTNGLGVALAKTRRYAQKRLGHR